jgi:hypothetical protein
LVEQVVLDSLMTLAVVFVERSTCSEALMAGALTTASRPRPS